MIGCIYTTSHSFFFQLLECYFKVEIINETLQFVLCQDDDDDVPHSKECRARVLKVWVSTEVGYTYIFIQGAVVRDTKNPTQDAR
jgi:hypothetical protein